MGELAGLRGLLTDLDYPMMVVTAADDAGERDGCLVGFATQCSVHPPRLAVFLSRANRTFRIARRATHLGVHFLAADQEHVAAWFGSHTGDDVDKLAGLAWTPGPGGAPQLDDCPHRIVGAVRERLPTGDHTAHVLEPVVAAHPGPLRQLGFQTVLDLEPGHEP